MKVLLLVFTILIYCIGCNSIYLDEPTKLIIGWDANIEEDLMNYRVYIDSVKVGSATETQFIYNHEHLLLGSYSVSLTALDTAGNESVHCEPVIFIKEQE